MTQRFLTAGLVLLVGACTTTEKPFVYANPLVTINKDRDSLHRYGLVSVCYSDTDLEEARRLALETCKEYGLQGYERRLERYQCKLTAPHKLTYRCYDPNMRFASGVWVNPLDKLDVTRWRREQMALTGKPIQDIYAGPIRTIPEMENPASKSDVEEPMELEGK